MRSYGVSLSNCAHGRLRYRKAVVALQCHEAATSLMLKYKNPDPLIGPKETDQF